MKSKSLFGITLLILVTLFFLNCSSPGTANVTIHINLGLNKASAVNTFENSIFDRIFRLFTKDAEAQSAPPHIDSITINISGSGMDAIQQTYSTPDIPDSISLEVPSGDSRLFEVLADTGSATLRGAVTQSLVGGTTVTIPITMGLYETKIVIPDYINNRIVQVDNNFSASSWEERNAGALGLDSIFLSVIYPYDIDFDNSGRIYIINYATSTDSAIIRVDSINGGDPRRITPLIELPTAIAIDRNNNIIYYANNYNLYSCKPDFSNPDHQDLTSYFSPRIFTSIRGLAVDNSGNLYIAADFEESGPLYQGVLKYNPFTHTITSNTTGYNRPWDIVVKGNFLYISNFDYNNTNNKIVQLDLNLQLINSLYSDPISTTFIGGPTRFVAILNNRFYILDDDDSSEVSANNRIIAFDDFNSNWTTVHAQQINPPYTGFRFYYC